MCKYRHVCSICSRNHPALNCPLASQHAQRPLGGGPICREADKNYSQLYFTEGTSWENEHLLTA